MYVYEEFLGFVAVAKMDAQTIADALLSTLQCGANLAFLVVKVKMVHL